MKDRELILIGFGLVLTIFTLSLCLVHLHSIFLR